MKTIFLILTILFPVVGIILAIIWLGKGTSKEKALGKFTFIVATVMMIITCAFWFVLFGTGIMFGSLSGENWQEYLGVWAVYPAIYTCWFFNWWFIAQFVSVFAVFVYYTVDIMCITIFHRGIYGGKIK